MNKISTILAVVAIALATSFYVIQNKQIQALKQVASTERASALARHAEGSGERDRYNVCAAM